MGPYRGRRGAGRGRRRQSVILNFKIDVHVHQNGSKLLTVAADVS